MTPLLQWFIALDHQFRDKKMTLRAFGELGVQMEMQEIEPVQMDRRFEFRWFGVESGAQRAADAAADGGYQYAAQYPAAGVPWATS